MTLEQLLVALTNVGGMGLLAAALLVLHRDALKSFREELQAERKIWSEVREKDRNEYVRMLEENRNERQAQFAEIQENLEVIRETAGQRRRGDYGAK